MRSIPPAPGFGQADLSNCELEQIHLAASIQPHGAMLVVRESDQLIVQASANAASFVDAKGELVGLPLSEVPGDLQERIRPHLAEPLHTIPVAVRCSVGDPPRTVDALLHRPPRSGLVIELEPAGGAMDLAPRLEDALQTMVSASSLRMLCDEVARIFKEITGFDRVMVYRFDDEGHGEVFSERRERGLEPYLGNRYPASDIPQIARRLYERNRVRVMVDVEYTPVPLVPRLNPTTGLDLDMSLSFLRSMSPIHVQYLKNMGVRATLVVSLVVGGRLWGLVACHHYEPRFVHYQQRAVCELLAESVATRIIALESVVEAQAELLVRRLEQRMIEAISRDGDWVNALFDNPSSLLQPVDASGAALIYEGRILTAGDVPATHELREIGVWLDSRPRRTVISTASLGLDEPRFAPLVPFASGVLATPLSNAFGEYLIWFRPERVRTITWAGNPFKPVVVGDDPRQLSPRRSFAKWHQVVEGTSEPWTTAELTTARLIGESVADVVLQFRSVRMLIVQDQLDHVRRQVRVSENPVIIADAEGKILLANESFTHLLGVPRRRLARLDDLPELFANEAEVRTNLDEMVQGKRTWRGEVNLQPEFGEARPLLVRADPVFSSPDRVLGFVLIFTDLTEQKAAEVARRRFQESIVERHRISAIPLDTKADLVFRNLLTSVVGNAQLAALEITDGVDVARMPRMLESVRVSIARAAELLEQLVGHAARSDRATGRDPGAGTGEPPTLPRT